MNMEDIPGRSLYYDMQGNPIDMMTWAAGFEKIETRRVAVFDGVFVHISTVYLGLDHGLGMQEHPPIIFETMVFSKIPFVYGDVDMDRYSTLAQAKGGHSDAVARWSGIRGLIGLIIFWICEKTRP